MGVSPLKHPGFSSSSSFVFFFQKRVSSTRIAWDIIEIRLRISRKIPTPQGHRGGLGRRNGQVTFVTFTECINM